MLASGGRKGQTRPDKEAWGPRWRDRGKKKNGEQQKMEAWMKRCRQRFRAPGETKKQEAISVSMDGLKASTLHHVLAHFTAL